MDVTYASLGKRFAAYFIDQLGFLIINIVFAFICVFNGVESSFVYVVLAAILTAFIELILLNVLNGKTIGKLIMRIRVVDSETLEKPSFNSLLKRVSVFRPILMIFTFANIGGLYIIFSAIRVEQTMNNQAIWDTFAGTVVIED